MGQALSHDIRMSVITIRQSGKRFSEIAKDLSIGYSTCLNLWRRYQLKGEEGLRTNYKNCGPQSIISERSIYKHSLKLKKEHAEWGAPYIITQLEDLFPQAILPTSRTLQRWFRKAGLNQPKSQLPSKADKWAKNVHQVWQIDAKERIDLPNGQQCCYLTTVDEKSGALLDAKVFSLPSDQSSSSQTSSAIHD